MSFNTNLDRAIAAYNRNDAQVMRSVYLTDQGEAYTCSNWFKWMMHIMSNFFTGSDMKNLKSVFDQSLQEYYQVKGSPLAGERVEDWSLRFQAQKERLSFVVALIQANQGSFEASFPNTATLQNLAQYLANDAPLAIDEVIRRFEPIGSARANDRAHELEEQVRTFEDARAEMQEQMLQLAEEQGRIQAQLVAAQVQIDAHPAQLGAVNDQLGQARLQLDQANENVRRAQLRAQQDEEYRKTQETDYQHQIRNLERTRDDLQADVRRFTDQAADLERNLMQTERDLEIERNVLQQFGTNPTAIAEALRQISEYRTLHKKVAELETEKHRLEAVIATNAEKTRADVLQLEVDKLKAEIAVRENTISTLRTESGDRLIKIGELEEELKKVKQLAKEQSTRAQEDLKLLREKAAKLEKDLQSARDEVTKLRAIPSSANPSLTQENFDRLSATLKKAQEDFKALKKANGDLIKKKDQYLDEKTQAAEANQGLQRDVARLTAELKKVKVELEALKSKAAPSSA